jgi:hypothetical protein
MEAVAWSALALLAATLVAAIFWLGTRIDGLGASLGARIDGLDASIDVQGASLSAGIDALTTEVASLGAEQARLSSKLEDHLGRHAS